MANNYGTNPMVFDTTPYITGTASVNQNSQTFTGDSTTWTTTTHPTSATTFNRDRVTEVSVDAGVVWYVVRQRDSNTQLTLEIPFAEANVSAANYLTRIRRIPRIKINSIVWLNPTGNDELVFRDKNHNIVAILRAGTTEQAELIFSIPLWVDGLSLGAIPSGTAYVYYD